VLPARVPFLTHPFQPPPGERALWDAWLFPHAGEYHLFYQQKRAGERQTIAVGHAITTDFVHWREVAPAYHRGAPGDWDHGPLRTGTTIGAHGRFYLFNGAAEGQVDKVGVSLSDDLLRWEKWPGNPVAVPDPRWYESDPATCAIGNVAWRDPCVLPDGDGFLALLCARNRTGPVGGRGTVATMHSADLLRWEVGPPLDVPGDFAILEVPDLFALDGRWFLLHSTTPRFGTRFATSEPELAAGTHVLWAERREGPYTRPPRDVLIGSPVALSSAWVCRTVDSPLGKIAYYLNAYPEPLGGGPPRGSFGLPKGLATDERGLRLRYLPILEPFLGPPLVPPLAARDRVGERERPGEWNIVGDTAEGAVAIGTSVLPLDAEAIDLMLTARVTIEAGRAAGIGLRLDRYGYGIATILDVRSGTIEIAEVALSTSGAVWSTMARRAVPLRHGEGVDLRVLFLNDVIEVFLADDLLLSIVAAGRSGGALALLADDARVRFADLTLRPLVGVPGHPATR